MTITRTIPDVPSTNIDKTIRFYTELLGFDRRTHDGNVISFVSASDPGVEVTLNDAAGLPPGFAVEVQTEAAVAALFDATSQTDLRVIAPLREAQFSVLDPGGRRVTVKAAVARPKGRSAGDPARLITRALPETVVESTLAKQFYAEFLGFDVQGEWPDVTLFGSSLAPTAQVLAVTNMMSPSTFDLDVGTTERVDQIHADAVGNAVVMGPPRDFTDKGLRCFGILDPNGVAINVLAPIGVSDSRK